MLVSGVQQSDSVIHADVSILFQILFPFRLLHNIIEQSSLQHSFISCQKKDHQTCQGFIPSRFRIKTDEQLHSESVWLWRLQRESYYQRSTGTGIPGRQPFNHFFKCTVFFLPSPFFPFFFSSLFLKFLFYLFIFAHAMRNVGS